MPDRDTRERELLEEQYRAAAGAVVRRLREERNWSYRDFGERVGVSHTSLYAIEHADTTPAIHTLAGVAFACGLTLPVLLSLIIDEMSGGERESSLAAVLGASRGLTDGQRTEVLGFIDYLGYRDRERDAAG